MVAALLILTRTKSPHRPFLFGVGQIYYAQSGSVVAWNRITGEELMVYPSPVRAPIQSIDVDDNYHLYVTYVGCVALAVSVV